MLTKHIIIEGKVQGVFYRNSTEKVANQLNLKGYVKNLSNGNVEIKVQGDAGQIEKLIAWCWQGPTYAVVTNVKVSEIDSANYSGFNVHY